MGQLAGFGGNLFRVPPPKFPDHVRVVTWTVDESITLLDHAEVSGICRGFGVPTSHWEGKAGKILWPAGRLPGRAWVVMVRRDLNAMNLNDYHTLTVGTDQEEPIVFSNLVISSEPINILTGYEDAETAPYLVEFSDVRHIAYNRYYGNPVNRQYNVFAPSGGDDYPYYTESLNGGNPWEWQEILDDLWDVIGVTKMGASPILPEFLNVAALPGNFRFVGQSAWEAYHTVLDRLMCRFVLPPTGSPYLVQIGLTDDNLVDALSRQKDYLFLSDEALSYNAARVPSRVVVYFHKVSEHHGSELDTYADEGQWSLNAVHEVAITNPTTTSGTIEGTTAALWDDLLAKVDYEGEVTNDADLTARALERATDYYRAVYIGGGRLHNIYRGFLSEEFFLPGAQIQAIAWYDQGHGAFTEIINTSQEIQVELDRASPMVKAYREVPDENLSKPDLARKTFPNYPLTNKDVEVTSESADGEGRYPGQVARVNPETLSWSGWEDCYVIEGNGSNLTTQRYPGRLAGVSEGLPLYVVYAPASGSGITARHNNANPVYGPRDQLDFLDGENLEWTIADDSGNGEIDIQADVRIQTSEPGSPEEGSFWFDCATGYLYVYCSGSWVYVIGPNWQYIVVTLISDPGDYDITGAVKFRFSSAAERSFTGFSGGVAGRILVIWNVGAANLIIEHDNGAVATNGVICPSHSDHVIYPDNAVILQYDGVSERWRFDVHDVFIGSGATATTGLVPRPPLDAGTSLYLREDATWADPLAGVLTGSDWTHWHVIDNWYAANLVGHVQAAAGTYSTSGDGEMIAIGFKSNRGGSVGNLGLVTGVISSSKVTQMGIYSNTALDDPYPDALVSDGGEVSLAASSTAYFWDLDPDLVLVAGQLYWIVWWAKESATNVVAFSGAQANNVIPIYGATNAGDNFFTYWKVTETYAVGGPMPDPFPAGAVLTVGQFPGLWYKMVD